jgi:two-component system cell cycle response regulator
VNKPTPSDPAVGSEPLGRKRHSTVRVLSPGAGKRPSAGRSSVKASAWRAARDRPVLFVLQGPEQGAVFSLRAPETVIGRDTTAAVSISEDTVSRAHARISLRGDGVYLEDLSSRNGTFVGDRRIAGEARLNDGDYVRIGDNTVIKFSMMDDLEERALRTLFELTLRDPLTRLYNRRYFADRLKSEFSFARRHGAPLALLLVDIDHFKEVNDTHGHQAGDVVLQSVACGIRGMMRPEDVLSRYGGEEFIVIARGVSLRNAELFGERIRRHIGSMSFGLPDPSVRVTISVGVACVGPNTACTSAEALVALADEALYRAKSAGRDRVCAAEAPSGPREFTERSSPRTVPPSPAPEALLGPAESK